MPQTAQLPICRFSRLPQLQSYVWYTMFLREVPLPSIHSKTSAAVKKANSPSMSDTTEYDTTPPPCREPGEVEPGKVASREELYLLVAPRNRKVCIHARARFRKNTERSRSHRKMGTQAGIVT